MLAETMKTEEHGEHAWHGGPMNTGRHGSHGGPMKTGRHDGHGWHAGLSADCIPGSYVKECVMLDDGPLECTTTVCDWDGRWKVKIKEVFNL